MGRRMKMFKAGDKAWVFLSSKPDGSLVPFAASLALTEKQAREDLVTVGLDSGGPAVCARFDASFLVDFCPDIPVYLGAPT